MIGYLSKSYVYGEQTRAEIKLELVKKYQSSMLAERGGRLVFYGWHSNLVFVCA